MQHLLPDSTSEELQKELARRMEDVGARGGFVMSPTHLMGAGIPLENLMVVTFTEQKAATGG